MRVAEVESRSEREDKGFTISDQLYLESYTESATDQISGARDASTIGKDELYENEVGKNERNGKFLRTLRIIKENC